MTTTASEAMTVGRKLAEYCRQGKHVQAIEELYADDVVSLEPAEMPGHPKRLVGKTDVLAKTKWFLDSNDIHGGEVKGPYPFDDDRVALWMSLDITPKEGPMAGQRMQMEEVCLYYVRNGRIVKEEFFYSAG